MTRLGASSKAHGRNRDFAGSAPCRFDSLHVANSAWGFCENVEGSGLREKEQTGNVIWIP